MLDSIFNYITDYVKNLLSFNLDVSGSMAFITTNGLLAYLIIRRILGFKYRIKNAIIVGVLILLIAVLLILWLGKINPGEIAKIPIN